MCARFSYWWLNHPTGIPDSATDVTNDQLPLPWFPVLDSLMTAPPNWVSLFKTQLLRNDPPNRDFPMFWDIFLYLFCCYLLLCCYTSNYYGLQGKVTFSEASVHRCGGVGHASSPGCRPPAPEADAEEADPLEADPPRNRLHQGADPTGYRPFWGHIPPKAHTLEANHLERDLLKQTPLELKSPGDSDI